MRTILTLLLSLSLALIVNAQGPAQSFLKDYEVRYDETYGEFERNKFDIILPADQTPHALVIYIHGGGFKHGDKKALYERKDDILYFLDNNIAVATINYRYYNDTDSLGVKLCLQDIKQAIQYIRHNASKYNIDKTRIGCYGISAGAGSSLFYAFHDDMAIPNDTTLLGESTRIRCAGALSTQATYDVFSWIRFIPWMRLVVMLKHKFFYDFAANFYGYKDYKSFKHFRKEITKSLDMLSMIDSHDPPVYLMNLLKETFPNNDNVIQHHKKHAIIVSKRLNKYHVENYLYTCKQANEENEIDFPVKEFLVQHLMQ